MGICPYSSISLENTKMVFGHEGLVNQQAFIPGY
jgi:hypothetical protein